MFNGLLIYIIILAVVIAILRTPIVKGLIGEFIVNVLSLLFLDKKKYKLIKNVTLPTEDGGSTQIDHIIVSKYGIFVVETKNMKGWIFGDPNKKSWTQVIYKTKNKFQNPLHQNYKHTKTLESLLGISTDCLFSVIVFMGDCTFKTKMPENIVYPFGYIRFVKSKREYKLDDEQVDSTIRIIEEGRFERSFKTHKKHVERVKKIVKAKENQCPKCGNPLVTRTVKKGSRAGEQFLGCSGFPKCRYTVQMKVNEMN